MFCLYKDSKLESSQVPHQGQKTFKNMFKRVLLQHSIANAMTCKRSGEICDDNNLLIVDEN